MHRQAEETVEVSGRSLRLTSGHKVLWPDAGFTKGDMICYYEAISGHLVPHIFDRPLVLSRHPDGVYGKFWFQSQCPPRPDWVRTCPIPKAGKPGEDFEYCVVDDAASLLWAANQLAIELHPLSARASSLHRPTGVVFDLDPGSGVGLVACCKIALALRDRLSVLRLDSYPKVTGSAGVHVYVPLNTRTTFEETRSFARSIARRMSDADPSLVTDRASRRERSAKVLIDWAQNNPLRSLVAPYSLRALPYPTVAAPVTWDEIESAELRGSEEGLVFFPQEVLHRVESVGDLLQPVLTQRQSLPSGGEDGVSLEEPPAS